MDYKQTYISNRFTIDDLIYDYDEIISHFYDKYDNTNTIKSYLFVIIKLIKENRYKSMYRESQDDIKRAYKKYFQVINNDYKDDTENDIKNKVCLIVDEY